MNKMERLLSIVLELQAREWTRAEELAAHFEVSKRTIYRDMQALSEAGVPVVAVTGQGYGLMEGYFLPPLNFNTDEALMLILGSDFMAQHFDAQYRLAAESASTKIEAAMPTRLKADVAYLRENIKFFAPPTSSEEEVGQPLRQIRRAIIERRRLRMNYVKRFGEDGKPEWTKRDVDPYSLARLSMDWFLLGFCHLRQDFRIFRMARIDQLSLLPDHFDRIPDYDPNWASPSRGQVMVVRALFKPETVRWVKESATYYIIESDETPEGMYVSLFVRDEREMIQWLLGWGDAVRVLEPESLCELLVEEAKKVIELYGGRQ